VWQQATVAANSQLFTAPEAIDCQQYLQGMRDLSIVLIRHTFVSQKYSCARAHSDVAPTLKP
jgi:hypothetical protein